MPNDDKQLGFERLDETRPERNERSFFDWLRGKEESDEEKLRKKLDQELKEAARTRAEQFEEEQRVEEKREVAETRKLKKRWRQKLVERSKARLEEAAERGDEPRDGLEIAKLMVAERIVKLDAILRHEDLKRSEVKAVKIHIDFMGLLSEKLDRPELEVPQEVEDLYQTIASSVEETTGENWERPEHPVQQEAETLPLSEAENAYIAFAATIVHAIKRALRPTVARATETHGDGAPEPTTTKFTPVPATETVRRPERTAGAPTSSAGETGETPRSALSEPAEKPDHPEPDRLLKTVLGAALPAETLRAEIQHGTSVRRLAEIVERAETMRREHEPKPNTNPVHAAELASPFPDKPIKFWSDVDLLKKAEQVPIGHGRLLADAYRKGEIDREGLIKILEAAEKGRDYRSEFLAKRALYRKHREQSPEYLPPPQPQQPLLSPVQTSEQQTEKTTDAPVNTPERPRVSTLPSIGRVTKEARQLAKAAAGRLTRQRQVILLLTSVSLAVALFAIVMSLRH